MGVFTDAKQINSYITGVAKPVLYEYDVALVTGEGITMTDIQAVLDSNNIGVFYYASIQVQSENEALRFVGKFSLMQGYDLANNAGRKVVALSEILLQEVELPFFKFEAIASDVVLHITIHG